jgi:hypothetical protein
VKYRPWPIVLLAAAHILAPILNILYSSYLLGAGLHYYLFTTFSHGQTLSSICYFLGFPIAGLAIYKTNRWSYPIFLSVMVWALYANFLTWRAFPHQFGLSSMIGADLVNLAVVSYFLIPAVRGVYFNPRLRWWETKPRYDVSFPGSLQMGGRAAPGVVQNIAEGGAFVESSIDVENRDLVELIFTEQSKEYKVEAVVVRVREIEPRGYGLQFLHTPDSAQHMRFLIRQIRDSGAHERVGDVNLWQEFKSWFVTTIKTGKGLVPDLKTSAKAADGEPH